MNNVEILMSKIRPVDPERDAGLPRYSYSRLELFKNCKYQYNKKYNEKKYTSDTTLALELGSLSHYVLEQKFKMLKDKAVDYETLMSIQTDGNTEFDEKTKEKIPGVNALKKKYWELWASPDNASGMNYNEKMDVFAKVVRSEMEDDDWNPIAAELNFEFVYDDRVILFGFIDRIDEKDEQLRTVDYKTSKKVFDRSKLSTSLQFGIYALAIYNLYGKFPSENMYRFILLDEKQYALTKGWEGRLDKTLTKILDQIDECTEKNEWVPSPTPLCHWCSYCAHNPDAHEYKHDCDYYSLWTPTEKTFAVNKEYTGEVKEEPKKRKLVF